MPAPQSGALPPDNIVAAWKNLPRGRKPAILLARYPKTGAVPPPEGKARSPLHRALPRNQQGVPERKACGHSRKWAGLLWDFRFWRLGKLSITQRCVFLAQFSCESLAR